MSTQQTLVTARAKLPDDLRFDEYAGLLRSVQTLAEAALATARNSRDVDYRDVPMAPDVVKVQYGSDFLLVLAIVTASAAAATAVAGGFLGFSKGLKILAEAGLANEERLGAKDKRLARRAKRAAAQKVLTSRLGAQNLSQAIASPGRHDITTSPGELTRVIGVERQTDAERRREAREEILPTPLRRALEAELRDRKQSASVIFVVSELAEYGVGLEVTDD